MKKINLVFVILAILVSSIGIVALFKPGFFLTDDGNSMIIRFSAFYEALRNGQFPARFLPRLNFGFGYPVADFLYPLFMYIGVPIHVLGFSFLNTIKIILGLSFLSGTVFSFLWLRKLFGDKSALVGSIVYSLFPYHLYDIYKRGSVGEILALGILPFVLWQIERRSLIGASVGIFLLILSHNTLAVLSLIFIAFYAFLDVYVSKNKKQLGKYYSFALAVGLGLSSFFSIPAVFDLQYTVFSKTSVSDWSKYFIDSSQIGISTFIVFLIVLIFMLIKRIEIKKHRLTTLVFLFGLISTFFASSISYPLWKILPVSFIQFPFRLLSLTMISVSFLSACIIFVLRGKEKIIAVILLIILTLISSKQFILPKVFQDYPDTFYSTNQDSTTVKNEYMPQWVKKIPSEMANQKAEVLKGKSEIINLVSKGTKINFTLNSKEKSLIQINVIYFPGWSLKVDGERKPIFYDNKYGIIQFEADKGSHFVEARFEETNVRLLADAVSVISFLLLIFISKRHVKFS